MAVVLKVETLKNYPKGTQETISESLGQKQFILPPARVEKTGNSWTKSYKCSQGYYVVSNGENYALTKD